MSAAPGSVAAAVPDAAPAGVDDAERDGREHEQSRRRDGDVGGDEATQPLPRRSADALSGRGAATMSHDRSRDEQRGDHRGLANWSSITGNLHGRKGRPSPAKTREKSS